MSLLVAGFSGCATEMGDGQTRAHHKSLPVTWTSEFVMPSLLQRKMTLMAQATITGLLDDRWYGDIAVQLPTGSHVTLDTCEELLAAGGTSLQPLDPQAASPLRELEVMCQATQALGKARPSQTSYVPGDPLNKNLPMQLPNAVALLTSQSEKSRPLSDPNLLFWNDINQMVTAERNGEYRWRYRSSGSTHEVALIGRGDLNGDGIEDALLTVEHQVEGGSFADRQLYAFSVSQSGVWAIIDPQ